METEGLFLSPQKAAIKPYIELPEVHKTTKKKNSP
jgi:hypothetical protein